eukprot:TRINITY_DN25367_c0_g1_i1.p1 TRINITY_DN25367_c0_g1~~TRINITY_DN25367_c0_g1_i1.p1  ORF type:complete len:258 (+),score=69.24 TRINITY_DN25367_c0_g1_i1:18-791(+)
MSIGGLPVDVLGLIFGFLDPKDLFDCFSVCKGWKLVGDTVAIKKFELGFSSCIENYKNKNITITPQLYKHILQSESLLRFSNNTSGVHYLQEGLVVLCKRFFHSNVTTKNPINTSLYWKYIIKKMGEKKGSTRMFLGVTTDELDFKYCYCDSSIKAESYIGWELSKFSIISCGIRSEVLKEDLPSEGVHIGLLLDRSQEEATLSFYYNDELVSTVGVPSVPLYPLIEVHGDDCIIYCPAGRDVTTPFEIPKTEEVFY